MQPSIELESKCDELVFRTIRYLDPDGELKIENRQCSALDDLIALFLLFGLAIACIVVILLH